MRRMRVSAQNIKAAEDAAGNHNDDGDKQYRVKHGRAPDLEAPSSLKLAMTGWVRLNQETAGTQFAHQRTQDAGWSHPGRLLAPGIICWV
jgi:hypothetical protein